MRSFLFTVRTPEGTFAEEKVEYVDLPTEEGGYGVLAGHAEAVLFLKSGVVQYVAQGERKRVFIMEGVAHVTGDKVAVTSDFAETEDTMEEALQKREAYYAEEKNRRKESYLAFKKSRIDLNRAMRNLAGKSEEPRL